MERKLGATRHALQASPGCRPLPTQLTLTRCAQPKSPAPTLHKVAESDEDDGSRDAFSMPAQLPQLPAGQAAKQAALKRSASPLPAKAGRKRSASPLPRHSFCPAGTSADSAARCARMHHAQLQLSRPLKAPCRNRHRSPSPAPRNIAAVHRRTPALSPEPPTAGNTESVKPPSLRQFTPTSAQSCATAQRGEHAANMLTCAGNNKRMRKTISAYFPAQPQNTATRPNSGSGGSGPTEPEPQEGCSPSDSAEQPIQVRTLLCLLALCTGTELTGLQRRSSCRQARQEASQ